MNLRSAGPLEITGGVIILVGAGFLLAGPSEAAVMPMIVMAVGLAVLGIARLVDHAEENSSSQVLMDQLRAERRQGDEDGPPRG